MASTLDHGFASDRQSLIVLTPHWLVKLKVLLIFYYLKSA